MALKHRARTPAAAAASRAPSDQPEPPPRQAKEDEEAGDVGDRGDDHARGGAGSMPIRSSASGAVAPARPAISRQTTSETAITPPISTSWNQPGPPTAIAMTRPLIQADEQFAAEARNAALAAMSLRRDRADGDGRRLDGGVAAHRGDDRHEDGERDHLADARAEEADDPAARNAVTTFTNSHGMRLRAT
jgi:hypothetical protein